jgi:hypothetical protein
VQISTSARMRSRASREELIRLVVSQLLTSMKTAPYSGGMTSQRCQGNNSQLFGIALSIYELQKLIKEQQR